MSIRYALIGCGRIAPSHIRAALACGLELCGVCDTDPAAMERLLAGTGVTAPVERYTDYRDLLRAGRPDLVGIAVPSGLHAAVALDCVEAGAGVVVEKPMTLSLADADRLLERAGRRGVPVCVCHQNRFNPAVVRTRQALDRGRLGTLSHGTVHVRWNRDRDYYAQAPWRGTWAQDGGCLMNQGIHGIDLLRWLMGDRVEQVWGVARRRCHPYLECEDVGLALVEFAGGAVGTVEVTTNVYPRNLEHTLCLFGARGTVKLGGARADRVLTWDLAEEDGPGDPGPEWGGPPEEVYGGGHTPLYADAADALVRGRAPLVDGLAGRRAVELVLAIYRSAALGRPVALPLGEGDCARLGGELAL